MHTSTRRRALAAGAALMPPVVLTAITSQPPQRFSATTVAVIVDATVRDRAGRPMACLDASRVRGARRRRAAADQLLRGRGGVRLRRAARRRGARRRCRAAAAGARAVHAAAGDRAGLRGAGRSGAPGRLARGHRVCRGGPPAGRVRRRVRRRAGRADDGPVYPGQGRTARRPAPRGDAARVPHLHAAGRRERGGAQRLCGQVGSRQRDPEESADGGRHPCAHAGPQEHRAVLGRLQGVERGQHHRPLPAPHLLLEPGRRHVSLDRRRRAEAGPRQGAGAGSRPRISSWWPWTPEASTCARPTISLEPCAASRRACATTTGSRTARPTPRSTAGFAPSR